MERTKATATLGLVLLLSPGCAALYIRDTDSAGTKAAKVAGRVLQGALTLGVSEFEYVALRRADAMESMMASWKGEQATELVRLWGPPTRKLADAEGGEIYSYRVARSYVIPGSSHTTVTANSQTSGTAFGGSGFVNYSGRTDVDGRATTFHVPSRRVTHAIRCDFWLDRARRVSRSEWWEETPDALMNMVLGKRTLH